MRRFIWLLGLLAIGSGCGGGSTVAYTPARAKAVSYEGAPATASQAPYGGAYDSERRADALEGGARAERPGLGTSWGETLTSRVRETPFEREKAPFAELALYYNDRAGVNLQASRLGVVPRYEREYPGGGGSVLVSILDGTGQAYETTTMGGRMYVVGREGERYSIHLRNRSPSRLEVVMSVDGLDVIDGSPGSPAHRGYLVMPYASLNIEGFRKSDDSVAAFRFSPTSDSYAEARGLGRNVGVIGLAFFREQHDHGDREDYSEEEIQKRNTADPFPHRYAPPPPSW